LGSGRWLANGARDFQIAGSGTGIAAAGYHVATEIEIAA